MSTIWELDYNVLHVSGLKKPYGANDPAGLVADGIAKPVRVGRRNTTIEACLLSTDVTEARQQALEALSQHGFIDHAQRVTINRRDDRTVLLRFEYQLPLYFEKLDELVDRGQTLPDGYDPRILTVGFYYVDRAEQAVAIAAIWDQLFEWGVVTTKTIPRF